MFSAGRDAGRTLPTFRPTAIAPGPRKLSQELAVPGHLRCRSGVVMVDGGIAMIPIIIIINTLSSLRLCRMETIIFLIENQHAYAQVFTKKEVTHAIGRRRRAHFLYCMYAVPVHVPVSLLCNCYHGYCTSEFTAVPYINFAF